MDTKVIGYRIVAFIIDLTIAWIVVIGAASMLLESVDIPAGGLGVDTCELINDEYPICFDVNDEIYVGDNTDLTLLILVGLGAWILIRVLPQGLIGRTPGKKLLRLRVVNAQGKPPGIGRSALRELLWIIDSLPFLYLVGLITAALTSQNRRIGDMAAGTLVVRAGTEGQGDPGTRTAGYASAPPPAPTDQPVWDPVRNAYVHTDAAGRVQVYDAAAGQWRPE